MEKSLLQMLEEVSSKLGLLESEKREAVTKIQTLEREEIELKNLISLAESKADEMLKGGSAPDTSKGPVTPKAQVTSVPLASEGFEELMGPSASKGEEMKRRYPRVFSPDWPMG
jgi:hypothetical protein